MPQSLCVKKKVMLALCVAAHWGVQEAGQLSPELGGRIHEVMASTITLIVTITLTLLVTITSIVIRESSGARKLTVCFGTEYADEYQSAT